MTQTPKKQSLFQRYKCSEWAGLALLSIPCVVALECMRMPAAPLLAGIVAGAAISSRGGSIQLPVSMFLAGQSIIGCIIARSLSLSALAGMMDNWLLALGIVLAVIACAFFLGWLLTVREVLPGTTAIWGAAPGAAMAMVLMSSAYGGDMRLVALMQYLRVMLVSILAAVVAWFMGAGLPAPSTASVMAALTAPVDWTALAATLALALSSAYLGHLTRVPAGPILLPMFAGALVQNLGLIQLELPSWLLGGCFLLVGWCIGLRFNRPVLLYALRVLPQITAAILLVVALAGGLAALLVWGAGLDPLTAYLATSPGGLDAVAVIAASSNADMPFIMAIQTARLLILLLVGPSMARFTIRCLKNKPKPPAPLSPDDIQ